jgi:hypothetical protein
MKTTLQTIRKYARKATDTIDVGRQENEPVFYYFGDLLPEQWCDEVCRNIGHTGWFTNYDGTTYKDGSGNVRGIVVELPAAPGFPNGRFLAGYCWGDNDERVLWPQLHDDSDDAARCADSHAEHFADKQREDNARFNAARTLECEIDDALTRLRECIALRHRQCMAYVRDEIAELCQAIRDKRETLQTEYADYV